MPMSDRSQQQLRNWLITLTALAGLWHEIVVNAGERPFLLTMFASMLGLPLVLGRGDGGKPPS